MAVRDARLIPIMGLGIAYVRGFPGPRLRPLDGDTRRSPVLRGPSGSGAALGAESRCGAGRDFFSLDRVRSAERCARIFASRSPSGISRLSAVFAE